MRKLTLIALGIGLPVILAACEAPDKLHPSFGNSVRHNMSMHIINPDPLPADTPAPDASGIRMDRAIDLYNTGETKELEAEKTSTVGESN